MARRPAQPNVSTPPSQGFVAGGSTPGLAGDASYEIGRLSAEIDNLKQRIGEIEAESRSVGRFHTGVKYVGGFLAAVAVILSFFVGDDVKTLLAMADKDQVLKAEANETQQKLMIESAAKASPNANK